MRLFTVLVLAAGLILISATPIAENNSRNISLRHEKRKRLRGDTIPNVHPVPEERTKSRNTEKIFLVNNRTLQILGESVQQILNDSKKIKLKQNYKNTNGPIDLSKILKDKTNYSDDKSRFSQSKIHSMEKINSYQTLKKTETLDERNYESEEEEQWHPFISDITSEITSAFYTDRSSREEKEKVKADSWSSSNTTGDVNYDIDAIDLSRYASEASSLSNILKELLDKLEKNGDSSQESTPPCQMWADCRWKLQEILIGSLPSCPCTYPSIIFYDDRIWDENNQRFYRWKDASSSSERIDIYKPGAKNCVRSIASDLYSIAAQHCCYDKDHRLLTRGSGAGSPNLVSPDISPPLHYKIDILPWHHCKGDFTRYNKVRPPNNGNSCPQNPEEDEYQRQVETATSF